MQAAQENTKTAGHGTPDSPDHCFKKSSKRKLLTDSTGLSRFCPLLLPWFTGLEVTSYPSRNPYCNKAGWKYTAYTNMIKYAAIWVHEHNISYTDIYSIHRKHVKTLKQKHLCWQSSTRNHRIQYFSHKKTLNQPTWLSLLPGVQSQGTPDKATDMRIWLNVVSSAPNQTCCSITSNAGSFDWKLKWDVWMMQWTTVLWNSPREV